ncbi:MAG TPA: DUF2191 domain-containing protein [Thermoanaerobaculia bacterium]|nr:DUF2191 domain-containing protein [Thermoanaerobaculia bacterium]
MKTTVELPDELLIAAKKRAAELRITLKEILVAGLRRELSRPIRSPLRGRRPIRWVTAKGGLAPGLDVSDRVKMYEWIQRQR